MATGSDGRRPRIASSSLRASNGFSKYPAAPCWMRASDPARPPLKIPVMKMYGISSGRSARATS